MYRFFKGDAKNMRYVINEDLIIFQREGKIIIDLYKLHKQYAINNDFIESLFFFCVPKSEIEYIESFQNYSEDICLEIFNQFKSKRIIVQVDKKYLEKKDYGINVLNKAIQYNYWANRIDDSEKYQPLFDEFIKLNSIKGSKPQIYKKYVGKKYKLTLPEDLEGNIITTLLKRQSIRYTNPKINLRINDLANILYYSNGETAKALDMGIGEAIFKTVPTPGGRAASELYLVSFYVDRIPKGIYHYSIQDHSLELIRFGDYREEFYNITGGQDQVKSTSAVLVLTERIDRIVWKYQDSSAYRSALLEAGAVMQNIYLVSTLCNLGVGVIGTFRDSMIDELLNLNSNKEFTTALFTLGVNKGYTRFDRPTLKYYKDGNSDVRE